MQVDINKLKWTRLRSGNQGVEINEGGYNIYITYLVELAQYAIEVTTFDENDEGITTRHTTQGVSATNDFLNNLLTYKA